MKATPSRPPLAPSNRSLSVAILQHSDRTPPGTCLDWLSGRSHDVTVHLLHRGDPLPDLEKTDWIIILGGPMNVDDVTEYPWLAQEKNLLKAAIEKQKICLGLCLGGQLLAQTLGGQVTPNKHWEVGWKNIDVQGRASPLRIFQFHQDQFSLPPGAERMATNQITLNQAFRYRDHVVGVQFHPEASDEWVRYCALDKARPEVGPFVDTTQEMIDGLRYRPAMTDWFFELLSELETRAYKL